MTPQAIFPAALQPDWLALQASLFASEQISAKRGIETEVHGERLVFPYRIYCHRTDIDTALTHSSGDARVLALCMGTRHCDGYVREECLRQLIAIDRSWATPFIVQLLGEYVIEIVELIASSIPQLNAGQLGRFADDNPVFMAKTRRRAVSYWSCYHRARFSKLERYPAIAALDAIERMARSG